MNEFLESHTKALYKLLGHEGQYSRMGALDYETKDYKEEYVSGENEVLAYARKWHGKRNVFIGRAARKQDGNPIFCRAITFDLDPIRPKDTASSNEQHSNALKAAQRVLSLYPGGYISSSGNGSLLIYYTGKFVDETENFYRREAVIIKELQEVVNDLQIKIDSTNYPTAVIKCLGTASTKGISSLRRVSKFVSYPLPPYTNCNKLLERLSEIVPPQSVSLSGIDVKSVMSRFNGDRSLADYHLVAYLKKSGAGPEDALIALQSNPLGRKEERPDDWGRLISKIYGPLDNKNETKDNYFARLFTETIKTDRILTGLSSLDGVLGALPKGEITTFAARSGFGKSTFACTISEHLRGNGRRVLYFSTEMHKDYLMHKLLSISCNIPLTKVINKQFTDGDKKRIEQYEQQFLLHPVVICDEFQPSIEYVKTQIIKYKPEVIVFDHISQSGTHWEKIAQFARGLKELTSQEMCVTLMLSQLNEPPRTKDGGVMTSLRGDVRGSQEIIFLSSIFMVANNQYEVKGNYQPVQIMIAKNRYGLSNLMVDLCVDKEISKYIEGKHND